MAITPVKRAARGVGAVWLGLFVLSLAGTATAADDKTVIARIGDATITVDEVRRHLETLDPDVRARLGDDQAALARVVRAYAARRLVLAEAEEAKWDDRADVKVQIEQARIDTIVASYLHSLTEPPDGYPSAADIQAFYDANKSQFVLPRQYKLAQIYVALPPEDDRSATEKAQKKVSEIERRLKQRSGDFAEVARTSSDENIPEAQRGAALWFSETTLVPEVRAVVVGLEKGGISTPIKVSDGWHVIRLEDTRPASIAPLADVRSTVVTALRTQRRRENEQAVLGRLLEKSPPAVNELALPMLTEARQAGR